MESKKNRKGNDATNKYWHGVGIKEFQELMKKKMVEQKTEGKQLKWKCLKSS